MSFDSTSYGTYNISYQLGIESNDVNITDNFTVTNNLDGTTTARYTVDHLSKNFDVEFISIANYFTNYLLKFKFVNESKFTQDEIIEIENAFEIKVNGESVENLTWHTDGSAGKNEYI